MTRIAFFHPALQIPGGAEFLCVDEARYLQEQGEEIEFVTLSYDPDVWRKRLNGIPVHLSRKRHWTDPFFGLSKMAKLRTRGRRAASELAKYDIAVAHNHPCNAMLGASGLTLRKVWQCNEPPRGLHVEEANPRLTQFVKSVDCPEGELFVGWKKIIKNQTEAMQKGSSHAIRTRYDIEQTAHLDHIFAISEFSRDNARKIYGRCGEQVVYPMVRFPEGGRTRSGLDRSGLNVLVHSRLETLKNIDMVLQGFAKFELTHPGAHLHIVGDGSARLNLESQARTLLNNRSFTFHGYLSDEDLRRVYDRCDVFALLTLDEPFGMVYPEAAAKGLLLIGPDHGGPYEILEGGRLGWCINPFAPEAMARALEEVWALSDEEVDRRRIEADRVCRARFSREIIGPQLRRVILEGHD